MSSSKHPSKEKYRDQFSTSDLTKDLKRKAVRGGAAVMGAELVSTFLRIGSMAVLARLLFPEDFGLLAMVTALTVFAERFKDLGLADATVQTREITHIQVSSLFWINLVVCTGIALLLASFSKVIAWFYDEPKLTAISLVISSTFLFSGLVIQHQAILRRQLRFGTLAIIQLSSIILSILVAIMLAYYSFGYWALVAREFSRAVFVAIGTWFACPWRPGLPRRKIGVGHLISFGKNVTGFNLVHFFSQSIDKILIGKLQGPYWVGLYTNAYHLITLPVNQIQYPVNAVALPTLSALQTDLCKFRAYYERMVQLLTFFSMPVVAFLALFADVIVGLLLGPKWANAIPIFRVFAVGAFVAPIVHTTGPAMVALGKTREYFRLGVINALSLLFFLVIGSFWGAMGVAIGYSISVYLAVVACFVYGLRHTPIRIVSLLRILVRNIFFSFLPALVLLFARYAMGWLFHPLWLVFFFLAGTLMYLGLWSVIPEGRRMLRDYWHYASHAMPWMK